MAESPLSLSPNIPPPPNTPVTGSPELSTSLLESIRKSLNTTQIPINNEHVATTSEQEIVKPTLSEKPTHHKPTHHKPTTSLSLVEKSTLQTHHTGSVIPPTKPPRMEPETVETITHHFWNNLDAIGELMQHVEDSDICSLVMTYPQCSSFLYRCSPQLDIRRLTGRELDWFFLYKYATSLRSLRISGYFCHFNVQLCPLLLHLHTLTFEGVRFEVVDVYEMCNILTNLRSLTILYDDRWPRGAGYHRQYTCIENAPLALEELNISWNHRLVNLIESAPKLKRLTLYSCWRNFGDDMRRIKHPLLDHTQISKLLLSMDTTHQLKLYDLCVTMGTPPKVEIKVCRCLASYVTRRNNVLEKHLIIERDVLESSGQAVRTLKVSSTLDNCLAYTDVNLFSTIDSYVFQNVTLLYVNLSRLYKRKLIPLKQIPRLQNLVIQTDGIHACELVNYLNSSKTFDTFTGEILECEFHEDCHECLQIDSVSLDHIKTLNLLFGNSFTQLQTRFKNLLRKVTTMNLNLANWVLGEEPCDADPIDSYIDDLASFPDLRYLCLERCEFAYQEEIDILCSLRLRCLYIYQSDTIFRQYLSQLRRFISHVEIRDF